MNLYRVITMVTALLVCSLLQGCDNGKGTDSKQAQKIYSITDAKFVILKTNPPQLVIMASGKVRTTGWTNPQLRQFVYIQPPPDGIYDFDFVAMPPSGPSGSAITDIHVKHTLGPEPANLKGARIHSETNKIEVMR